MPSARRKARASRRIIRRTIESRRVEALAEAGGIEVLHAIPGRARVRIDSLKRNPVVARRLSERLANLPGMRRVEANALTGTVLLLYDPDDTRWLDEFPHAAGTRRLDIGDVRPELEAATAPGGNGGQPATQVTAFFGALNQRVAGVTGGFDLAVLVPALLVLLGLRGLVAGDSVRTPTWYDFLWFGFGTFVMLNAGGGAAPGE